MPRPRTILKLPKLTAEKLELEDFELAEQDLNKNPGVGSFWERYDTHFNSLSPGKKMRLNELTIPILGAYWTMLRQSRADRPDRTIRDHLNRIRKEFKELGFYGPSEERLFRERRGERYRY